MISSRTRALADDLLGSIYEIAGHIGKPPLVVEELCERGDLPAFRLGHDWCMRRSAWRRHVEQLEADAVAQRPARQAAGTISPWGGRFAE